MSDRTMLINLENKIKEQVPSFEVRFKDESMFMKILSKILFFNKNFMTSVTTTIGTKVYWASRERYEAKPGASFRTLAHEFVHIVDFIKRPVRFVLGYLFPQIFALLALFAVLAFISPWFLLFLLALLFLAPLPAPFRKTAEMRGYGMSVKTLNWLYGYLVSTEEAARYVKYFTGPSYYFMWPFKESATKEFSQWVDPLNNECLREPVYKDVYDIITKQTKKITI